MSEPLRVFVNGKGYDAPAVGDEERASTRGVRVGSRVERDSADPASQFDG